MPDPQLIDRIREAIEWAALGIEILGAVVIFAGVMRVAFTRGTVRFLLKQGEPGDYESYKCWIAAIQAGETAAEALLRHARDPELAGHAFAMLPLKLDELRRIDHAVT